MSGKRGPEHWSAHAGARGVARLEIPADLRDDRHFEISVRLQVRPRRERATHALRIQIDGALEWARRAPTSPDGDDGLEWRSARTVPAGRALRIVASGDLDGAERLALTIVAEESAD